MVEDARELEGSDDLRRRAEARLAAEEVSSGADEAREALSRKDAERLIHELKVHQIELEMQNEELRRTHLDLEGSREKYFDLYDRAPVGYLTLNAKGLIQDVNLAAATLLGVPRCHLVDRPFTALVLPEDQDVYYHHRRKLVETGGAQAFELRLVRRPAGVLWARLQAVAAEEGPGIPVHRITLSDVSEAKRTEEAMLQAQKLESLGVLAGGIAHDFNNLLAAMMGNLELAELSEPGGEECREHFDKLREVILRAAGLCRQMLAYSGKGHFVRRVFDVNALVRESINLMQVSIPKSVDLSLDLEPGLPGIEADLSQIQQALMNLVLNASEAIGPGGGTVRIRTRRRVLTEMDLPSLVPGTAVEPGPCVVVEVEDSGMGMDPETVRRIFDPFFTTKFEGRGLGLAAFLGIVRGNRGALHVASRPGQGSLFRLWFPAVQERSAAPEDAPHPAYGTGRWAGTALVVEDEESVRVVLASLLRHLGFEVLTAEDGEAGLRAYRRQADRIRVVFMDLTMPRMDGLEATRRILEEFPAARIILMSGYARGGPEGPPEANGASGFLKKPFLRSDLSAVLERCLEPALAGSGRDAAGG